LHKKLNYAKKNDRQSFDKRKTETISFQILLNFHLWSILQKRQLF